MSLFSRSGGSGDRVLLLLHGMGATADVWQPLIDALAARWPGRWIAPDLPGHGGSPPLDHYTFEAVASAIAAELASARQLRIIGHSLGGVIGLVLASGRFGVAPEMVVGLGIKVCWSDDELAKARALASKPITVFPNRAEAADRFLKVAGLAGLVGPGDIGPRALREAQAGWTLAFDSAAFAIGAPDMPALLAQAQCPVVLAAGSQDPMCPANQLRDLVPDPVILEGPGHNAHVERPDLVAALI